VASRRPPTPGFFVNVAAKELTDAVSVNVAFKGVTGGRLRSKHGKRRCCAVSVDSEEVKSRESKVEKGYGEGSEGWTATAGKRMRRGEWPKLESPRGPGNIL
jgi:hypothetical protein